LSQAACESPSLAVSFPSSDLALARRVVAMFASVAIDQSSPEKALERMEGVSAPSSAAVSVCSSFSVSTFACNAFTSSAIRRCSESRGSGKSSCANLLIGSCDCTLPDSLAEIWSMKAGEFMTACKYCGQRTWGNARRITIPELMRMFSNGTVLS